MASLAWSLLTLLADDREIVLCAWMSDGTKMPVTIIRIIIAIRSSSSVNPAWFRRPRGGGHFDLGGVVVRQRGRDVHERRRDGGGAVGPDGAAGVPGAVPVRERPGRRDGRVRSAHPRLGGRLVREAGHANQVPGP